MVIEPHLPILQIVVPLTAAPLCVLLRQKTVVWVFALIVSWTSLAISIAILMRVLEQGPFIYALGSWTAPWGIEIRNRYNQCLYSIACGDYWGSGPSLRAFKCK